MGDDAPPGFSDNVKSVEDFNLTCDTNAKHAREIANARRMAGAAGVCGVDHWDPIACALRGAVLARGNKCIARELQGLHVFSHKRHTIYVQPQSRAPELSRNSPVVPTYMY